MGLVSLINGHARTEKRRVCINIDEPRELPFHSVEEYNHVIDALEADKIPYTIENVEDPADAWIDGQFFGDDKSVMDEALRIHRSLEEFKAQKLTELSTACQSAIFNGVDVEWEGVVRHYSLNLEDQSNLNSAAAIMGLGMAPEVQADGEECRAYSPEEFINVASKCFEYVRECRKRYHDLKAALESMNTIDDIAALSWE